MPDVAHQCTVHFRRFEDVVNERGGGGFFITSSALNIFSSECCFSSKSISFSNNSLEYFGWIAEPSETNTLYPSRLARSAAPTPLSPAPSMTSRLLMDFIWRSGLRGFFVS